MSRSDLALWLALLAAFSPSIAEFAHSFADPSWSSTVLLAPVLIAIAVWRGMAGADEPRRAGLALLAAGLLLELIGIELHAWTLKWLGFPVAVVGLALWLGRPSWRVAVLAFGLLTFPVSVQIAYSPAAESALLSGACTAWRVLGLALSCTGPVARYGDRGLELIPADLGWNLAVVLAELGWFVAVSRGAHAPRALRAALAFAAGTVLVQPVAVGIALALLVLASRAAARSWLSHGVWLGCTVGVLLWSLRPERRFADHPG